MKRKSKRSLLTGILLIGVILIGFVAFFAAKWYIEVYGQTGFDSVLFTLFSGLNGVQSDLIGNYLLNSLLPALICTAVVGFVLLYRSKVQIRLKAVPLIPSAPSDGCDAVVAPVRLLRLECGQSRAIAAVFSRSSAAYRSLRGGIRCAGKRKHCFSGRKAQLDLYFFGIHGVHLLFGRRRRRATGKCNSGVVCSGGVRRKYKFLTDTGCGRELHSYGGNLDDCGHDCTDFGLAAAPSCRCG